jgi:predicted membrane protein (TIGR00267 family)
LKRYDFTPKWQCKEFQVWRALKNIDLVEGFQGVAFGTMDGLITILGVVIGIATATGNTAIVILSGIVVGVANSIGNCFGFYASELAERAEHIHEKQHISSMAEIRRSTVLAFVTSLASMSVLIVPFALVGSLDYAMIVSLSVAMAMLFGLGVSVGKLSREGPLRFGVRYVLLGLTGAALSFVVGTVLKDLLTLGQLVLPW